MAKITIGADPEFFIREADTGLSIPVCGLLGGTKEKPIPVGAYGVQEDNVMCEYNIPPVTDVARFARHIREGRAAVMERLGVTYPGRYDTDLAPSRLFSHAALDSAQARVFGCSPDFDAYAMGAPHRRFIPEELEEERGGWRFAGGHVHIGYHEVQSFDVPPYVAAQFADVFIGLTALEHDKQGKRREYYGTPGRYRPTSYGIEYRTLSNAWTYTIPASERVGMSALRLGMFFRSNEAFVKKVWSEIPWQDVRRAISTENVGLANTVRNYCQSLGMEV